MTFLHTACHAYYIYTDHVHFKNAFQTTLWVQSFTSLMADLQHQDKYFLEGNVPNENINKAFPTPSNILTGQFLQENIPLWHLNANPPFKFRQYSTLLKVNCHQDLNCIINNSLEKNTLLRLWLII